MTFIKGETVDVHIMKGKTLRGIVDMPVAHIRERNVTMYKVDFKDGRSGRIPHTSMSKVNLDVEIGNWADIRHIWRPDEN